MTKCETGYRLWITPWQKESSAVTKVKESYRQGSPRQRVMIRAWMRRVLDGGDGNDKSKGGK